ncbi:MULTISPECIES: hypothetical protein [Thermodesulfovibrio]|jgi:hypothetical protein|uniref:Uncharacterized protein n=1 Tax=Thermodesulfovibrio yellowstonii (strain ATCC 51303 / DSM 11347 / YP87) TaxID=289376 RepID=B5YH34_THEYD|nr:MULTISPECIES: hypothetical protein [Thermodesulfovibrio]ACI21749.1 hypothetical protein THEYE_A1733 [Thermodesulfovibrio yellowstonii DSM 11347]MDI6865020.1 hypothetical protein [Thermodesulfovibrio yellowstonii]
MEYINNFMYFVIRPVDKQKHIYCSGVNLTKFSPITKGRHRLGQNPAVKGLQTLNNDIRAIVIENNATPETIKNLLCQQIKPLNEDLWYTESFLIHNYSQQLGEKIEKFAPSELLRKMLRAMLINENIPENLSSQEFQTYLYSLAEKL